MIKKILNRLERYIFQRFLKWQQQNIVPPAPDSWERYKDYVNKKRGATKAILTHMTMAISVAP